MSEATVGTPFRDLPWREKIIILTLFRGLPVVAVLLTTYNVVIMSTPDIMPVWAAILVGLVGGGGVLAAYIINSGGCGLDVIATSVVFIVLNLVWLPTAPKMKAIRLRNKEKAAIRAQAPPATAVPTFADPAGHPSAGNGRLRGGPAPA